jgi:hypothetical protein
MSRLKTRSEYDISDAIGPICSGTGNAPGTISIDPEPAPKCCLQHQKPSRWRDVAVRSHWAASLYTEN